MSVCAKIPYPTRGSAEFALRAIHGVSLTRGRKPPTGAYFCTPCRQWHLTSKSKSQVPPWHRHVPGAQSTPAIRRRWPQSPAD